MRTVSVSRAWKAVATALLVLLLLGAALAGSYALSLYSIRQSQRQWCVILALAAASPGQAHPAAAQRRAEQQGRAALAKLRGQFGCR